MKKKRGSREGANSSKAACGSTDGESHVTPACATLHKIHKEGASWTVAGVHHGERVLDVPVLADVDDAWEPTS